MRAACLHAVYCAACCMLSVCLRTCSFTSACSLSFTRIFAVCSTFWAFALASAISRSALALCSSSFWPHSSCAVSIVRCVSSSLNLKASLTAACLSIAVCLSRNAPALREFSSSFVRIARSCLSRPFAAVLLLRSIASSSRGRVPCHSRLSFSARPSSIERRR